MQKISTLILAVCLLILPVGVQSNSQQSRCGFFPPAVGYVNDFENIFLPKEKAALTKMNEKHRSKVGNEIAIVTIPSIEPYNDLFHYSLDLANCWGVGNKQANNGVLIVFSSKLRQVRIQNGKGIVSKLTDAETKEIIDSTMIPLFKNKGYYEGFREGLKEIMDEID